MSVSVDTGLSSIPSPQELGRGALAQEGPITFIISWAIIAVAGYISSAGLVVTFLVGLFATFMVGIGLFWLAVDRLLLGGGG